MAVPNLHEKAPCYFLTLSRELRDIIYEHCLVVDHPIEPYPPDFTLSDGCQYPNAPGSPALLSVNRQVYAEARETFYGKNEWRIPVDDSPDSPNIFHKYPEYFRKIIMAFDIRDVSGATRAAIIKSGQKMAADRTRIYKIPISDIPGARARAVHTALLKEMTQIWEDAWHLLEEVHFKYVKVVTIDLENLGCPSGCCRIQLLRVHGSFLKAFLRHLTPKALAKRPKKKGPVPQIFIQGLLNAQDRERIVGELEFKEAEPSDDHESEDLDSE